jgi:uroporphyrinogen-III synthase
MQGIQVDYMDLYRRQLPIASTQQWHDLQSQAPHIAFISSGESLDQWLNMAGQHAQKMPVLVISPRLAILAQQKGFQTVLSSASIKTHDIIATLCQWYNTQRHGINA